MRCDKLRDNRGFSMIELVIGITITFVVVGAFINMLIQQNHAYSSESLRQGMNLNGRIALDEIEREAMNLGTGLPGIISPVHVIDGGGSMPDTISFINMPQVNIFLRFAKSPPPHARSENLRFSTDSDVNQLKVGDLLFIYDEVEFNIIQITSINYSNRSIVFVAVAGVVTKKGLAKNYDPDNTVITRLSITSITVDRSVPAKPRLVKFQGATILGTIAENIENLQATLLYTDGSTAGSTSLYGDARNLRAIEVILTTRSERPDARNQEGDRYWRQTFSTMIAPRNIVF